MSRRKRKEMGREVKKVTSKKGDDWSMFATKDKKPGERGIACMWKNN